MQKSIDYQGVLYTVLQDFGDLKTVKDTQEETFLLVTKRGLLIPANEPEFHYRRYSGNIYIHGIPFKVGRVEKKGDSYGTTRNCTTTLYNDKVTFFFFLSDDKKDITEVMCPQFG